MRVAQVTARLAETIVEVTHVAPGERYTIGTAPDVQLALAGVREFPLAATRGYDLQQCMGPGDDPTKLHRGAAVLELDIAPDGSVKKVRGQGPAARCAATVIASLAFPAADVATHATFTIGYP